MNLRQCIFTNNACYQANQRIEVKGIMWHSTGANNPNLRRYVQPDDGFLGVNRNNNHWNRPYPDGVAVCVHAWIGKLADGSVATYQTLPWNINGWHSGGSANSNYIGFEICEDALDDEEYLRLVYQEAVELSAYLCKLYTLNPLLGNTIIDHSTGAKLGIASGHADVMHWFSRYGITIQKIRNDVAAQLKRGGDDLMSKEYEELVNKFKAVSKTIEDYTRNTTNALTALQQQMSEVKTQLAAREAKDAVERSPCPDWAKQAVSYCIDQKYIKGDGKETPTVDNVRPMAKLTRAEMCQIIYNRDKQEKENEANPAQA